MFPAAETGRAADLHCSSARRRVFMQQDAFVGCDERVASRRSMMQTLFRWIRPSLLVPASGSACSAWFGRAKSLPSNPARTAPGGLDG